MTRLSDYFAGVVVKRLSEVETNPSSSNQHEFNGTKQMEQCLGADRKVLSAEFVYIAGDEDEFLKENGDVTWYDAREQHPTRSEYRLYFHNNEVMARAVAGDILVIGLRQDQSLMILVVESDSPDLPAVLWLFGTREGDFGDRLAVDPGKVDQRSTSIFNRIAELVGLDMEAEAGDDWLDRILEKFGADYPATHALSSFALETLREDLSAVQDPDDALLKLMDREETLFRQLENHIVGRQITSSAKKWADDVDAFISFSLSVHNRRKSRAGHALENHLAWIFRENRIRFSHGATTEGRSRPDFLFPSADKYHDNGFPATNLTMLGAKTTCKDRWRQVLNEAARIPGKHLLTLQPAISVHQTDEMRSAKLSLIIPRPLHSGYTDNQQQWLLSLRSFIQLVRGRETASGQ
ncbi:MAG: restriction endonuclease [Gammaproteobacteria bacterium]|nr:restriction endonuclease [Gammaproteobacteria bacterium]